MLDPGLEESKREELAQTARGRIDSEGTLKHEDNWGLRKMAYEIEQRTEADYRWYRFEAGRELLSALDHNLKITDGILRFRIFRVDPRAPVGSAPPAVGAPAPPRAGGERGERGERSDRSPRPPRPDQDEAEPAAAAE